MTEEAYDSVPDTLIHIGVVKGLLEQFVGSLKLRAEVHDQSKMKEPEKAYFDKYTPKLKDTTYGSDEYNQYLKELKPGLDHHYAANRHHPEFHPNGISDMNLVDVIELFCDWLAATIRHTDGDIHKSIDYNEKRFAYSSQIGRIFHNTACVLAEQTGMDGPWKPGDPDTRTFSVECFVDGMRLMSDKLSREDAISLCGTAQHLVAYLTDEYHLTDDE